MTAVSSVSTRSLSQRAPRSRSSASRVSATSTRRAVWRWPRAWDSTIQESRGRATPIPSGSTWDSQRRAAGARPVPGVPRAAPARSGPDTEGGRQASQQRDRRQVGELAGARILGGDVLDLDREPAELALDRDPVLVHLLGRRGEDLDARLVGADAGERQRGEHVHVGGEGPARLGGRPLEDQRFLRDRVEVDLPLRDPGSPGEAVRGLARLHRDGGDRADAGALDAVEPRDRGG